MTEATLILNNFRYDIEDRTWYGYTHKFMVREVEMRYFTNYKLYYGGYDIFLGDFTNEDLFLNKMKTYKIKILRLEKLEKLKML